MKRNDEDEADLAFFRGVDFEVAQELLNDMMAHYTHIIAVEMEKEPVDQRVIDDALQQQEKIFQVSNALRVNDGEAIKSVISIYGQKLRELDGLEQGRAR